MKERSFEEGLLKTSFGMSKRFEAILKPLNVFPPKENEKIESSLRAVAYLYNCSKKVARYYYEVISMVNKSELANIKRKVGVE